MIIQSFYHHAYTCEPEGTHRDKSEESAHFPLSGHPYKIITIANEYTYMNRKDLESVVSEIEVNGKSYKIYSLKKLSSIDPRVNKLPYSLKVVLESMLRNIDDTRVTIEDIENLLNWDPMGTPKNEVPFIVSRVLMQDFTGVPAVVDLAAMRDYVKMAGKDPAIINPHVQVDLVIDHSVQVDSYGSEESMIINRKEEFRRNYERYKFLKWAQGSFKNFRVVPPSTGIVHQVNLEYLASVVMVSDSGGHETAYFDSLVGTDSHTTMINGLGITGWGVGGIEAEASLLGEPVSFLEPKVVSVNLHGKMREGVTATDIVLTLTQIMRKANVVGKFVEFIGDGISSLSVTDRATMSNMCPEYGATLALFPVDEATLDYLRMTGRSEDQVKLVETYFREQGLFGGAKGANYSEIIDLDLSGVEPSISGPRLPQQRLSLSDLPNSFLNLVEQNSEKSSGNGGQVSLRSVPIKLHGRDETLSEGDIVIAAITSCTNTSNPRVMIGAGLLAKKAFELGLRVNPKVKTSLAPGSRVVTDYLKKAGLQKYLDSLGFYTVGYGCTTCIGNSGPLDEDISKAITSENLFVSAVLSGNRNFEARIHRDVRANYLMSPPLVVAYAIAGTVMIDLSREPLGVTKDGREIYLRDIWPKESEITSAMSESIDRNMFVENYRNVMGFSDEWNSVEVSSSTTYPWDENSTYIRNPPFFQGFDPTKKRRFEDIRNAYALLVLGDSVTTDHISPAGTISRNSPAGKYLMEKGVKPEDFNTYGARRGNHEVMVRGTFSNPRIRNLLSDREGGYTKLFPDNTDSTVFDASVAYVKKENPLIVIAGREYGSGSTRDWAAKGPMLLGVKAVVAQSFERIHRSNLIGMGIIPLTFRKGESFNSLNADATKPFTLELKGKFGNFSAVLHFINREGKERSTPLEVGIYTPMEFSYFQDGGILQHALCNIMAD